MPKMLILNERSLSSSDPLCTWRMLASSEARPNIAGATGAYCQHESLETLNEKKLKFNQEKGLCIAWGDRMGIHSSISLRNEPFQLTCASWGGNWSVNRPEGSAFEALRYVLRL
jgi:hypothetical protein